MAPAAERALGERQRQRRTARKATELENERMRQEMTRRSKLRKQMLTRVPRRASFAVAEVHALNAPTPIAAVV